MLGGQFCVSNGDGLSELIFGFDVAARLGLRHHLGRNPDAPRP